MINIKIRWSVTEQGKTMLFDCVQVCRLEGLFKIISAKNMQNFQVCCFKKADTYTQKSDESRIPFSGGAIKKCRAKCINVYSSYIINSKPSVGLVIIMFLFTF